MLKRTLILAVAAVIALAVPAGAQSYGQQPDAATVSDSTVTAGQAVTVTAQCFLPGTTVTFTDGQGFSGTGTANASGVASVSYTVPAGSGNVTVQASGTGCDGAAQVLGVVLTRQAAAGAIPRTGDDSLELGRIGIALIAVGGAAVYAVRRRRVAPAAA